MYIYKAAVVGAGTMGAQIAQVISYSGLPVTLMDLKPELVEAGIKTIRSIYETRAKKGKMSASDVEQKMALVSGVTGLDDLKDADIVVEAVFEDLEVKKSVLSDLDRTCSEGTILATNSSSLSISALASATQRRPKVIGLHFFNPAHVMKLVEVVPGLETSMETMEDVMAFAESLRKIPVKVQECAGFLVNRLLMPYLNEASYLLQEGGVSLQEIDQKLVEFGMPMGPFALLDMIGIDVADRVARILHDAYGPRMEAARILALLVQSKRLGTKTGSGFYQSSGGVDRDLERMIGQGSSEGVKTAPSEIVDRLLLPMVNEAAICLQEQVASAEDIDTAMMAGTGFPQDKGGPLHYADTMGIDLVVEKLEKLSRDLGPRFWPAPIMKRMVGAGHLGKKQKRGFFAY